MKTIKTRNRVKGIKVLDKPANLFKRMKDAFVRTKEAVNHFSTERTVREAL